MYLNDLSLCVLFDFNRILRLQLILKVFQRLGLVVRRISVSGRRVGSACRVRTRLSAHRWTSRGSEPPAALHHKGTAERFCWDLEESAEKLWVHQSRSSGPAGDGLWVNEKWDGGPGGQQRSLHMHDFSFSSCSRLCFRLWWSRLVVSAFAAAKRELRCPQITPPSFSPQRLSATFLSGTFRLFLEWKNVWILKWQRLWMFEKLFKERWSFYLDMIL